MSFVIALVSGIAVFGLMSFGLGTLFLQEAAYVAAYGVAALTFLGVLGGGRAFGSWLKSEPLPQATGLRRYFTFCMDHKVIGIQYLYASSTVFLVAGIMALMMRVQLARPALAFLDHRHYNTVMTLHGLGMVAVALTAIVGGLGNYFVPLMIGADDMAFPRLNALSFWLVPCAVVTLLSGSLWGGFDFGWTAYAPLAERGVSSKLFFLLAFLTVGTSSILGGVNFIATILFHRRKDMGWFRMPIFVWSILATAIIILLGTSVVASALIMTVSDRLLGSSFYDASRGGNPLLYEHLFWFYSHPAVYIMALPAFGTVLQILPAFARKPLFAYPIVAVSFVGITVISFIVWAHHMFVSGMWKLLNLPFMVTTELISIPTGVVFLSILGTLWMGKLRFRAPMLWVFGFIYNFLIGGLTGIFLADVPTDLHAHDTWFVVAHFHFTIVGSVIFALFAAIYYWFPRFSGRLYSETLAKWHFWLFTIGFNFTFIPMFWLGLHGMRRRVIEYPPEFVGIQTFISLASTLIAVAVAIFLYNIFTALRKGPRASPNPWEDNGLEWRVPLQ